VGGVRGGGGPQTCSLGEELITKMLVAMALKRAESLKAIREREATCGSFLWDQLMASE